MSQKHVFRLHGNTRLIEIKGQNNCLKLPRSFSLIYEIYAQNFVAKRSNGLFIAYAHLEDFSKKNLCQTSKMCGDS